MRRIPSKIYVILMSTLAGIVLCGTSFAVGNPSRAVSLNALVAAVRSGKSTEQVENLCGMTRLCGYIVDTDSKDVVLLGVVDPHLPALHLDDFVIAIRNTRGAYNRVSGRMQYYSDPGCSIDPNPLVLGQLRDLHSSNDALTPQNAQARTEEWKKIGSQAQKVRVLGVPFDSHFAKVMVDADYYMKRIVNGSVALGIEGLRSLSDLDMDARRQIVRSGKSSNLYGGTMNRFWFSPGESTYEVRDGAVLLRSCKVKLLTEEEFLTEQGAISQMGRPNPAADIFAQSFSQKYDQIAEARPIYKELNGLFRFVAVARLLKDDKADRSAESAFSYLLRSYTVGRAPVSRLVNGLTDVRQIDEMVDTPKGSVRFSLVQSTCGGVSMNVRPRRIKTVAAKPAPVVRNVATVKPSTAQTQTTHTPAARTSVTALVTVAHRSSGKTVVAQTVRHQSIKRAVLSSRKSANALSWDVPVQLD